MSLAVRVIPTLLVRGEHLVKGTQFNSWRVVGHAMQAARIHAARGVDELIMLDIGATPEGRGPNLPLIERLSEFCHTPLTVGGGVKSVEDVYEVLRAGADKVAIGNAAWGGDLVAKAAQRYGSQAIVVTCDVVDSISGVAAARCLREAAPERAAWIASQGAGEILLTSVDREGTMQGYDHDLIRWVSGAVDIPVISHGGCRDYKDMMLAIAAGASAVAAGALFQFTEATPREAVEYLDAHGVTIRIPV